jgi:hypothetical protein
VVYGTLTEAQAKFVREVVRGRRVHDLGAGICTCAKLLLQWGATEVIAIDKERYKVAPEPGLTIVQAYFEAYINAHPTEPIDVAFVSWPANRLDGDLIRLVSLAKTIVYLGKNTDGSMCGDPHLFKYFLSRRLEKYIPDPRNALIVLGEVGSGFRPPQGEELAGLLSFDGAMLSYKEAENAGAFERRVVQDA